MKKSRAPYDEELDQLSLLDYEIDESPLPSPVTSHAGLPAVLELFRVLGGSAAVERHVRLKSRQRGFSESQMVESFLALLAAGGDCPEDFESFRGDSGLQAVLGRELPSRTPARNFLYGFHDKDAMAQRPEREEQASWVPPESAPLAGLGKVNETVTRAAVAHGGPADRATLDMDASITESAKREAYWHYQKGRGYQPEIVVWTEQDLIVADEFRDGNVPAAKDPLSVIQQGFGVLPETVRVLLFRGDSACYDHRALNWLRNPARPGGPAGPIIFAISAVMSKPLREAMAELDEQAWEPLEPRDGAPAVDEQRHVADIPFVPEAWGVTKDTPPDRYVGIRIRPRQSELLSGGNEVKYFAIVSNDFDSSCSELVHWHRAKAGTVEHVHDVLKNELGAGGMPCGRFGANAAWYRLNVLTYNVLSAFKRLALPSELRQARPKKLRFRLLGLAGKVVRHAGRTMLRIAGSAEAVGELHAARSVLKRLWRSVRAYWRKRLKQWRTGRPRSTLPAEAFG